MRLIIFVLVLLVGILQAKYFDSHSCQECHEKIYDEHMQSMHAKSSLFEDKVHAKVKNAVNKEKYACALCHMPSSKNLAAIMRGQEQPNPKSVRQSDGVSCSYCHQISKVHKGRQFNINFSSATEGANKPIMFGNLSNPDDTDKHESKQNKIYKNSQVCMGCHSHKLNSKGFEVCNTKDQFDKTSDCISCHMPKAKGGNEKYNRKNRKHYATHEFLGIHSPALVKKAVELKLSHKGNRVTLYIKNMMGHSIITHPMRLKFVKTVVKRGKKIIWSNFKKSPLEDKNATFIVVFKDSKGNISMPHKAIGYKINLNLKAKQSKTVTYEINNLQKGDKIISTWVSFPVNPKIAKKLKIKDPLHTKPIKGATAMLVIN